MAVTTRDRILDAALRAFATRGVEGTPITDLEAEAGLAAGSGGFYRYFKTKDEVLVAVVRREMDRAEATPAEARLADPTEDPATALRDVLGDALVRLRTFGPLMAVLSREQGRIPELATEVADRMIGDGLRRDAVVIGPLLGVTDPEAIGDRVAVILSALVGYTLATGYFGRPPGEVESDRFVAALADLLAP